MHKFDIALQIARVLPELVDWIHKISNELRVDISENPQLCAHETVLNAKAMGKALDDGDSAWHSKNLIPRIAANSLMAMIAIENAKPAQPKYKTPWAAATVDEAMEVNDFTPYANFVQALRAASTVDGQYRKIKASNSDGEFWTTDSAGHVLELREHDSIDANSHLLPEASAALLRRMNESCIFMHPNLSELERKLKEYASSSLIRNADIDDLIEVFAMSVMKMAIPNPIYKIGMAFRASKIGWREVQAHRSSDYFKTDFQCFLVDTGTPINIYPSHK